MHLRVSSCSSSKQKNTNKKNQLQSALMASQPCTHIFTVFLIITAPIFSLSASHQNLVQNRCHFTSAKDFCNTALFPESCRNSLGNATNRDFSGPEQLLLIFERSALTSLAQVSKASSDFSTIDKLVTGKTFNDNRELLVSTLEICATLLSLAIDNIDDSLSLSKRVLWSRGAREDVRTWLSAAVSDIQTCIDEFDEFNYDVKNAIRNKLDASAKYVSNSLAIATRIDSCLGSNEMEPNTTNMDPYWVNETRHLLDASPAGIRINLVVAQDGSGNHKGISEAIEAVPDHSSDRFVILVKKGIYYENVRVGKSKWNVMMMGEGSSQTIVSGNLSYAGGTKTFETATFAVFGRGFVAREMAFVNTAPASQAVALLSTSDRSVFFQCLIESRQDTLYLHSHRQFYRECTIRGTMDFIFGNSAAVIQTSLILPKNPSPGRVNVITAHGRSDPNQETGLSVHNCTIQAGEDLGGARTFLGRPWGDYSRVAVLQTWMDGSVDPEGWLARDETQPSPSNVFYAEYGNTGPGANTSGRVRWPGVKVGLDVDEAEKFTVGGLISGQEWLPETGVPYEVSLL